MKKTLVSIALTSALASTALVSTQAAAEVTANASATSNYIWRGLTQTTNETAIQGGIDYSHESGFYAGTWVSNVQYAAGDDFSYEHDLYFGFSGEVDGISYDVGYLYYNYDDVANFDFAEIYGSVGYGGFTLSLNVLAHTEADEAAGQDFGFGQATYTALDYTTTVLNETELTFHVGYHDGDFNEAFNGVPESYLDYGVSVSKNGFTLAVTDTDLDDSGSDGLDNDEIKFTVSYSVDFEL